MPGGAASVFAGLMPHRCQWVGQRNGVDYLNDSESHQCGRRIGRDHGFAQTSRGNAGIELPGGDGIRASEFRTLRQAVQQH